MKTPLPQNVSPIDPRALERDVVDVLRKPLLEPVGLPAPPLPDYVEHKADVPRVGRLTAEAVAVDYESAAKEIEVLGKQLTDLQKRLEQEVVAVHEAIVEVKGLAQSYRDEGLRLFNRMEECSLLTKSVREACADLAARLGASK